MIRLLLSFCLFVFSFAYSASCSLSDAGLPSGTSDTFTYACYQANGSKGVNSQYRATSYNDSTGMLSCQRFPPGGPWEGTPNAKIPPAYSNNKCPVVPEPEPEPEPPKKCDFGYCSASDMSNYREMLQENSWYETCSSSSQQSLSFSIINGGNKHSVRFVCDNPSRSVDVCFVNFDEPQDCEEDISDEEESPQTPDSPDVPCFGNVEGCSNGLPPDYVDPETGIPCWGELCDDATPPNFVDPETGVPCWGDKCGLTPPSNSGSNGNGTGSNGSNGTGVGTGQGGHGNNGGIGSGDGLGSGNWDVPGGGIGSGVSSDIPESFWSQKNNETIKDKYDKSIRSNNPYDFTKINTDIGFGSCPKFETEFFGNVAPPCWLWDLLGNMFAFLATISAFMIVFWRR